MQRSLTFSGVIIQNLTSDNDSIGLINRNDLISFVSVTKKVAFQPAVMENRQPAGDYREPEQL